MTPSWRERGALLAGRTAGLAARRLGRGGGTALPGLVAGALAPGLVEELSIALGHGLVTVTGTNGKTTTAHLLAGILTEAGLDPLANRSGSNLERGIVAAYAAAVDGDGRLPRAERRIGILEVDEAELPRLYPRLRPRVAVFLNLFRDQLDRYGEVDSVATGWRAMLAGPADTIVLLNADDPTVATLAEAVDRGVVTFGVDDDSVALTGPEHASDARFCPDGTRLRYDAIYMGHVGRWYCDCCGRRRPAPDVSARDVELLEDRARFTLAIGGSTVPVELPMTGLYTVYNAAAAAAAAHALAVDLDTIARGLAAVAAPFGRQERFAVDGRSVRVLLAKNPAGLNEVIRALAASSPPFTVLAMLNDGIQDGRDVSWIYDADLELLAPLAPTVVCAGDRAEDMALRWHLAGVEPRAIHQQTERALDAALDLTPAGGRLDVVATYTAMLDVREGLARRTGTAAYWSAPDVAAPPAAPPGRDRGIEVTR